MAENGNYHGFKCIDSPTEELPIVPMKGMFSENKTRSFFASVLPNCYGYKSDWKYELTRNDSFLLDADAEQMYTLEIIKNGSEGKVSLVKRNILT